MTIDRLMTSVVITTSGCWEWQRCRKADGYGRVFVDGKVKNAHCAAYELLVGPIPSGNILHHHCENPPCCNPSHLTPVPRHRHSAFHTPHNSLKTHCKRGHPFSDQNTYIIPSGAGRACRECKRQTYRDWEGRNPDKVAAKKEKRNERRRAQARHEKVSP